MKKLFGLIAVLSIGVTVIAADAENNEAVKKDLSRLQGEWSMQSGTADGFVLPEAMRTGFKRVCKGNELTVTNGDQVIMRAKITIDPSKTPKMIDYDVIEGPTKGKKHLGIYEFDGSTMRSCFGAPDMKRPTDFTSKQGDKRTLSEWKRAK
jgi:uncharacterized protein (TIGR03067 family)